MIPQTKQFHNIRRGRISAKREAARQLRIRNNLERIIQKRLTTLFRKFVRTKAYLYREFGVYDLNSAIQDINEELLPLMSQHYRKTFRTVFASANELHDRGTKEEEVFVMGQNVDFERLVASYYAGRTLALTGVSRRIANKVDRIIRKSYTSSNIKKHCRSSNPNSKGQSSYHSAHRNAQFCEFCAPQLL